jgi:uncharacterized protein YycO
MRLTPEMKSKREMKQKHHFIGLAPFSTRFFPFLKLTTVCLLLFGASILAGAEVPLRLSEKEVQPLFGAKLFSAQGNVEALEKALDDDILAFQTLIEEGFVFRQKIAAMATELKASEASRPLSGADIDRLNNGILEGMDIIRRIFAVVDVHAQWRMISDSEWKAAGFTSGIPVPLQTKGTMLSLAGSLFLYDSYRLEIAALAESEKARRIINAGDKGYQTKKNLLNDLTEEYLSTSQRGFAAAALRFCEENQFAAAANYGGQSTIRWLQQMIAQSPSCTMLRGDIRSLPAVVAETTSAQIGMFSGDLKGLGEEFMNTVSLCFGNTVGLVEVRKGKLWKDAGAAERIKGILKPGDILLEKTPFRLTDTFIPGHWGHAAIWVGTEAELKELGLWDNPVVKPHQADILAGRCIVEALRSGVTMNTVEHFLNIDDLAVLRRDPELDVETRRHHILLALRQVGKAYDFNFDVETIDKIVCSELVYVVYTDMAWPTDKTIGRYTISPDNVALKALNGGPFRLVLFYHDGQQVNELPVDRMSELMNRANSSQSILK